MRLATIVNDGRSRPVAIYGESAIDLAARVDRSVADLGELLVSGLLNDALEGVSADQVDLDLAEVEWLPPVLRPQHIFCVGLNYDAHRTEAGRDVSEYPTIFLRAWSSQVAHKDALVVPRVSNMLDYEGELAVIVGKGGRYIPAETALSHLVGASCYNDATVRDYQRHTTQWTPGKNFTGTGAFGPWLVTMEELDLGEAHLSTTVNGEEVQRAKLGDMLIPIPRLIEYLSTFCVLQPGDVIVTGTPGGVGFLRDPPRYLVPGDSVEVEIEGVGRLENVVSAEH